MLNLGKKPKDIAFVRKGESLSSIRFISARLNGATLTGWNCLLGDFIPFVSDTSIE
jgi:hypothetical protein